MDDNARIQAVDVVFGHKGVADKSATDGPANGKKILHDCGSRTPPHDIRNGVDVALSWEHSSGHGGTQQK